VAFKAEPDDDGGPVPQRQGRVAHSVIERRYRENLNAKIAQLNRMLSTMEETSDADADADSDSDLEGAKKSNAAKLTKIKKADVLSNAMKYIKQAEQNKRNMSAEIDFLKSRITAMEKLIKCEDCSLLNQVNRLRLQGSLPSW
jgi:wobble nucleotide-excising tRNase